MNKQPVVLVTGGARRVGAAIVRRLHAAGCVVAIHYRRSAGEADALAGELNAVRAGSAGTFAAALEEDDALPLLVDSVVERFGRLDGLVNNASAFYPTRSARPRPRIGTTCLPRMRVRPSSSPKRPRRHCARQRERS